MYIYAILLDAPGVAPNKTHAKEWDMEVCPVKYKIDVISRVFHSQVQNTRTLAARANKKSKFHNLRGIVVTHLGK
jgi:hypothetical protein